MDSGVIAMVKKNCRLFLLKELLFLWNKWEELQRNAKGKAKGRLGLKGGYPTHIADAINILYDVWEDMFTPDAIKNCWAKATFFLNHHVQSASNSNTSEQERTSYANSLILTTKAPSDAEEMVESELTAKLNDQVQELQKTLKTCQNEMDIKDIFSTGKMKSLPYPSRIYFWGT